MDSLAGTAPVANPRTRGLSAAALVAAELALVALGAVTGHFTAAVMVAVGAAFFLLAIRAPTIAAIVVWIVTPFSVETVIPGGSAISLPTEPLVGLALLGWLVRAAFLRRWPLRASPLLPPLVLLGGIALVSLAAGRFPVVGLKAWLVSGAYAMVGLLAFAHGDRTKPLLASWIRIALVTTAALGLYGAIRSIAAGATATGSYGCARPFFPEHGTYAAYLSMMLPVSLLAALEWPGRHRWIYGLLTGAILLGIAFSFTRAAWVSIALVLPLVIGAWALRRGGWRTLGAGVGVVAVVALAIVASGASRTWSRHVASITDDRNVSNLERLNRWSAAIEMARTHPWLGVGYGAYPDSYRDYRQKSIVTEQVYFHMGVHNELLRILAETGVMGLAAALWFLAVLSRMAWRRFREDDGLGGVLALAILAGLASYAVHSLFNSYLGLDKVTIPFWFGIGALNALRVEAPRSDARV